GALHRGGQEADRSGWLPRPGHAASLQVLARLAAQLRLSFGVETVAMRRAVPLLVPIACLAGAVLADTGTARSAPSRPTIEAFPNPATAGHQVTIKGRLVGAGGGVQ